MLMKYNQFLKMFTKMMGIMSVLFHHAFFNHMLESFCSEIYAVLLNCPSFSLKTNLGDLLFILYYIYSVANANCYLYILVLILSELVIDCFELKTFIPLIFN